MKTIFLISGKLQSGKNQFAEYLTNYLQEKEKTVESDLFAKGVKDGCKKDYTKMAEYLNKHIYKIKSKLSENFDIAKCNEIFSLLDELTVYDDNWYEDKTDLTRIMLQTYGTEIFRDRVHDDYWTLQVCERSSKSDKDVVIITDTRFENEIELVKDNFEDCLNVNVVSVRVNRPDVNRDKDFNEHESEKGLDKYKEFDYVVTNDSTLEILDDCSKIIADEVLFGANWEEI